MTAIPTRPPFPPSDGIQLAVIYFAVVVGLFGLMLPFIVAISVMDGDWTGWPRVVAFCVAVALVGYVALALARRKPWSRLPAIVVTALMIATAAFGAIDALLMADEHGSTYVLMGGLMWFAFGVFVLVKFVRTAGPDAFRPHPSGWIDDPVHEARLRYEAWYVHTSLTNRHGHRRCGSRSRSSATTNQLRKR